MTHPQSLGSPITNSGVGILLVGAVANMVAHRAPVSPVAAPCSTPAVLRAGSLRSSAAAHLGTAIPPAPGCTIHSGMLPFAPVSFACSLVLLLPPSPAALRLS